LLVRNFNLRIKPTIISIPTLNLFLLSWPRIFTLATPITAEEQNWVDKFIIGADEEIDGDMSWMNWILDASRRECWNTLAVKEIH
jgi:hypothetical protein